MRKTISAIMALSLVTMVPAFFGVASVSQRQAARATITIEMLLHPRRILLSRLTLHLFQCFHDTILHHSFSHRQCPQSVRHIAA